MKKVLFLCTGNYYRSRFSEYYFNHHAERRGLNWRAESMGLMRDVTKAGNEGAISQYTRDLLDNMGIAYDDVRMPMSVQYEHFDQYDKIVAASHSEHFPVVFCLFTEYADQVHYFKVEDIHIETPEKALAQLVVELDGLLEELSADA